MPELLGRYELERKIAQGGMGEIILARQAGPGGFSRKCVIKRMHPDVSENPAFVQMFLAEARVTAHLNHPNIAQLYDFGQEAGAYYLAMEYVPGVSLAALNRWHLDSKKYIPTDVSLRIMSDAARALHYAHTARDDEGKPLGLVHRDVSPGNILVSSSGIVKLIDFGVAKVAAASVQTQNGVVKGKVQFMAPEQVAQQPVDARTDVYAAGLVTYELLTGRRAFPGGQIEVVMAVGRNQFPPIETARPGLPPKICAVVTRALATKPGDRYPTAADFASALEAELSTEVTQAHIAELVAEAGGAKPKSASHPVAVPPPQMPAGPVPQDPRDHARSTAPHAMLGDEDLPPTAEKPKVRAVGVPTERMRVAPAPQEPTVREQAQARTLDNHPVVSPPSAATARTTQITVDEVAAALATQRVRSMPDTTPTDPQRAVERAPAPSAPKAQTRPAHRPVIEETVPDEPTTMDVAPPMDLQPRRISQLSQVSVSVVAPAKSRAPMIVVGLVLLAIIAAVVLAFR